MHVTRSDSTSNTRYFHLDHLGSLRVISNEAGTVLERLNYDPWGKRRNANGTDDTGGTLMGQYTDRGFTGHEHLEEVQLIHMNGRVYDPRLGRFMQADPFIQDPLHTQDYNRYSYGNNNPLSGHDPSGYGWKKIRGAIKVAVGAVLIAVSEGHPAIASAGAALIQSGVNDLNGEKSDNNVQACLCWQTDFGRPANQSQPQPRRNTNGSQANRYDGNGTYTYTSTYGYDYVFSESGSINIWSHDHTLGPVRLAQAGAEFTNGIVISCDACLELPPRGSPTLFEIIQNPILGAIEPVFAEDIFFPGRAVFGTILTRSAAKGIPARGYHIHVTAPRPVSASDATSKWDEFLGPGPHTNIHPRTGAVDPDRIVSGDGRRSIRYGRHEMDGSPAKHHYHEETWTYDPAKNAMNVDSTLVRIKK